MLPLSDLTQLALRVRNASQEGENTAVRVGTALADLCAHLKELPDRNSFRFEGGSDGVSLVVTTQSDGGQSLSQSVVLPLLSATCAGVLTPGVLSGILRELRDEISRGDSSTIDVLTARLTSAIDGLRQEHEGSLRAALSSLRGEFSDGLDELRSVLLRTTEREREEVQRLFSSIANGRVSDGVYYLSEFVSEEVLGMLRSSFPDLSIRQPAYTGIVLHDGVVDGTAYTNLENGTGYGTGKDYVVSGHIRKILDERSPVLFRLRDGRAEYTPLSRTLLGHKFPDGSVVATDGSQGELMVREPGYWYKGVNDILLGRKYAFYTTDAVPLGSVGEKVFPGDMEVLRGKAAAHYDESRVSSCVVDISGYTVYRVKTRGFSVARIPACRCGDFGAVVGRDGEKVWGSSYGVLKGLVPGGYIVVALPKDATDIYFTLPDGVVPDFVWLTHSRNPVDWEPDWVRHDEEYVGIYGCADGRSSRKGASVTATTPYSRSLVQAQESGFELAGYETFKNVFNLGMAWVGRRVGFGSNVRRMWNWGTESDFFSFYTQWDSSGYTPEGMERRNGLPNEGFVMGYELLPDESYFDYRYVKVIGINSDEFFECRIGDRALCYLRNKSGVETKPTHVVYGRYMDFFPAEGGAQENTHYYSSGWSTAQQHFLALKGRTTLGFFSFQRGHFPESKLNVRIVYRGVAERLDKEVYLG